MPVRKPPIRIFLIGPMGAGKTAVGRRLAAELDYDFHDTDILIQDRTGVDIPFIFEKEGEAGFRRREQAVIAEYSRHDRIVLATGGGAILAAANRAVLAENGLVVYLHASVAVQLARTRRGQHRPLLDTDNPQGRLATLFAEREPLYAATAHLILNTDGHRVDAVVRELLAMLPRING